MQRGYERVFTAVLVPGAPASVVVIDELQLPSGGDYRLECWQNFGVESNVWIINGRKNLAEAQNVIMASGLADVLMVVSPGAPASRRLPPDADSGITIYFEGGGAPNSQGVTLRVTQTG